MTDHNFIIPPPKTSTSTFWAWFVATMTMRMPRELGYPVTRVMVYMAVFLACMSTVLYITNDGKTPVLVNAIIVLMATWIQWMVVALILGTCAHRERWVDWKQAECDAFCKQQMEAVLAMSERHRAQLVSTAAKANKALREEAARLDGEGWKRPQAPPVAPPTPPKAKDKDKGEDETGANPNSGGPT